MRRWFIHFALLSVILLLGYGSSYTCASQFSQKKTSSAERREINSDTGTYLARRHFVETFKRKICLFDNEENEENFSSVQKQLVKNNYFLIFHNSDYFVLSATAFTRKVNDCKIFSLLYNKVYLLIQVFRI
jgi:hypothetical protein